VPSKGEFQLEVAFDTTTFFVDAQGQESHEINFDAVAVREVFNSAQISELG
jgi:hypothetical protein